MACDADIADYMEGQRSRRSFKAFLRRRWWLFAVPIAILCAGVVAGAISYHRFYHHVTAQEVSHSVEHGTFETTIRGGQTIKLHIYQQANANGQPLVLFTSGDGGWSPFCADIAGHVAATGKTVVGFDSKDYLTTFASAQKPVTPEELARDYEDIINAAQAQPGINPNAPVTLSGWSLGAGYSVLIATAPQISHRIGRVVAVSLPSLNELAWKPSDAVIYITHGTPHEKVFDAHDCLTKMDEIPFVLLNASDDDTAPVKDARSLFERGTGPKKLYIVKAWGHHFEGGEREFYRVLDEAFAVNLPGGSAG
jgi:dienelactone hydrolase